MVQQVQPKIRTQERLLRLSSPELVCPVLKIMTEQVEEGWISMASLEELHEKTSSL